MSTAIEVGEPAERDLDDRHKLVATGEVTMDALNAIKRWVSTEYAIHNNRTIDQRCWGGWQERLAGP